MSTTINFTNIYGDSLSSQQINMIKDYRKEYFVNNIFKKSEEFINGVLNNVRYDLEDGESINNIISLYNSSVTIFFFKQISMQNSCRELSVKKYISGNLDSESILIEKINSDEEIIYDKTTNSSNGVVTKYEKYYYENDELRYMFEYFDNGDVYKIISFEGIDSKEFHYLSDLFTNFNWIGLEYYKKGIPKFPN